MIIKAAFKKSLNAIALFYLAASLFIFVKFSSYKDNSNSSPVEIHLQLET